MARRLHKDGYSETMKANRVHGFGGPDAIAFEETLRPLPEIGQVLVRVRAAVVGPWDAWVRSGRSAIARTLPLTLGSDLAGTVEAVGSPDSAFVPGDEIYGVTNPQFTGANAEFAVAMADMIALKPNRLRFVEAASVPVVAVTAWQMLFEHADITRGERVLVHGGAGNVGAYAVQLARLAGAHVAATALPSDVAEVLRLGARQIIDIGAATAKPLQRSFDAVIDTVGGRTQAALFPLLRPGGTLVSSVSQPDPALAKDYGARAIFFLVRVDARTLTTISALLESGRLTARVGTILPLAQARRAHEMLEGIQPIHAGKIVLAAAVAYA
jgi:NADPH:quinone reductase-like Zn-dependent oxidoreductase